VSKKIRRSAKADKQSTAKPRVLPEERKRERPPKQPAAPRADGPRVKPAEAVLVEILERLRLLEDRVFRIDRRLTIDRARRADAAAEGEDTASPTGDR
jgi:hypothetical protein